MILFYCILSCNVSSQMSDYFFQCFLQRYVFSPLYVMCLLSMATFKTFSLLLVSNNLLYTFICFLCIYPPWASLSFFDLWLTIFTEFRKFLINFFKYVSTLSFWKHCSYTTIRHFNCCPIVHYVFFLNYCF